jgi:hypothetical protein
VAPQERETTRSEPLGRYTPGISGAGAPAPARESGPRPRRIGIVRWRGIVPLILLVGMLAAVWALFGDRIVETTGEEVMTKLVGAEVEIDGLRLRSGEGLVEMRRLAVADPFDPRRNLFETGPLRLELEHAPLLEKKLVLRRLGVRAIRFGVPRAAPARPAPANGYAARTLGEIRRWRGQFDVPLLKLTPIDTIRSLVLDPAQLLTIREAVALRSRADSVRGAIDEGWNGLRLTETLDSARSLGRRLSGVSVRSLGLDGTRQAIADVKRTIDELDAARKRVDALDEDARTRVALLVAGVNGLDEARRRDYAFATGLLQLPTFEGPAIGNALFGEVSIDRFERALYWAEMAERHMPPGLKPRQSAGPTRQRLAGTSVQFAKPAGYPSFLLRRGDLSFELESKGGHTQYSGILVDVTSQPALVGRPTRFATRRSAEGTRLASVWVNGLLNHLGAMPRDSVSAVAEGMMLTSVDLPGLPLRAELGSGSATLRFARHGEELRGRWTLSARQVQWQTRTGAGPLNQLEANVTELVSSLHEVDVVAELSGTIKAPRFAVRSNLDRVIAERVHAVAGKALAKAEAKARAKVDGLVEEKAAPARAQVAAVRADVDRRIAEARSQLDEERARLDARLRGLSGGILTLPKIPGA